VVYIYLSLLYLIFGLQTKRHLGGLIECRPLTVLLVKHDEQLSVDDSDFGVIPSTRSQQVLIRILDVMTYAKYSVTMTAAKAATTMTWQQQSNNNDTMVWR